MERRLRVHGLDLSYFTGKLEAYLRAKGITYELVEMTTGSFRECAKATGVLQMPQVEMSDGSWLTDTTLIIRYIESQKPEPRITPLHPVLRFLSVLIEDFGDETLWRPALYYRWAFADDARLMSGRLARGMLRDLNLPYFVRRQIILRRQQSVYLKKDGVTPATHKAIEQLYLETLSAMEQALAQNHFVLGTRPTEADFGLFGGMFRHFFSDPTPAKIMRERAPRTLAWVARMWALTPAQFQDAPENQPVPESVANLLHLCATSHLSYLQANATACATGQKMVNFKDFGADFSVPASPYRAWCLAELQREYQLLSAPDRAIVDDYLEDSAALKILSAPAANTLAKPPSLPIKSVSFKRPSDRNWI